jgi:hypothetical protein
VSLAALDGNAVTRVRVMVPAWGRPWADVDLVDDVALTGVQTLTLADVTLSGHVYGGAYNGRASYRMVAGAGGWGETIAAKSYNDDLGVKQARVLEDAAAAVGETLSGAPTTRGPRHFAREAGPASEVLNAIAPRAWYVGLDGVTYFGTRDASAYTGDGVRLRNDPGARVLEVATEEIATLVPGVSVDGSDPAVDVEYILDETRLTVRLYLGTAGAARVPAALASILDALDPARRYRGTFEFRVVTQNGERLNLQPMRASSGFDDLRNVPVRLAPGIKATWTPGALALVTFVDADPARPVVVAGDDPDAPGHTPIGMSVGGLLATLGVCHELTTFITTCPAGAGTATVAPGTSSNTIKVSP